MMDRILDGDISALYPPYRLEAAHLGEIVTFC